MGLFQLNIVCGILICQINRAREHYSKAIKIKNKRSCIIVNQGLQLSLR